MNPSHNPNPPSHTDASKDAQHRHLEVAEGRFRDLLESVDAIIWEADAATLRLDYVSQGVERILGFSADEWIATPNFWAAHLHPEDRGRALDCEREVQEKGHSLTVEYRLAGADGRFRWFRDSMHAVKGAEGNPDLLRGIMVEIKQSECGKETLRESEKRYRDFISHTQEGVWCLESEKPIPLDLPEEEVLARLLQEASLTECNPAHARNLGFSSAQEVLGKRPVDLLPYLGLDTGRVESFRSAVRGGFQIRTVEYCGLDKAGAPRQLLRTEIPIVENGSLVRIWGITRDVTELRRAEEELRLTRFSLEHTTDGVFWMNPQGRIVYVNEAAGRSLGYSREELLALSIPDIDPLFTMEVWQRNWPKVKEQGSVTFETQHRTKQGTVFPVEITATYLEFEGKEYSFAFARDIRERKRAEKELADRFRFETLLAELSTRFVHVPAEQIDGEIKDAQRRVCESLGLDACSLWQVMPETPSFIPLTHIYRPTAGAPIPEAINAGQYLPWSTQQILAGKIIVVSSLEELPTEAARDRQTFGFFGIKSVLTLGLSVGGGPVVGGLAFSTRTARTWPQELVKRLQTVAELFCSGLERQRAERALRESEGRFRSLFENATVGIYRTTPQGSILMANPALVRMLGFKSFEELAARNLEKDGFEPNYPRRLFRERMEKKSEVRGMEEGWTRQDGSIIFVRESAQAIRGEDGSIEYYDGVVEDITEHKRAEEALRNSEKELRQALLAADMGVWEWRPAADTVTWDENLYRIAGRDTKLPSPSYREHSQVFAPESLERLTAAVENCLRAGTPYELDLGMIRPDGSKRWVIGRGEALRDSGGHSTGLRGTVQDITERKRAEDALRRANDYNRSLIEASLDPLITIAPDGKIADVNTATENVTGRTRDELIGTDFCDYFTDAERARAGYQKVFHEGLVRDYELEIRHHDGHTIPVLYNAAVYRDEAGTITGVFAAARDITERKKAEAAVAYLSSIVEYSDDAIIGKSCEGVIQSWNKGAERLYGYTASEMIGESFYRLAPPDQITEITTFLDRIERGEVIEHHETVRIRKDGTLIDVSVTISPIRDASGRVTGASTVARDITERKRAEEEKQQFLEQLRALAVRLQSTREEESKRLAREIHDLVGQALTALKFAIISLLGELPGGSQPWSRRISSIETLINQTIHTVGHISSELRPGTLDHLGLAATVEWAGEDFESRTGIKCRLDVPEEELALDSGRATAIYRILQELLTNVARHAAATEVEIELAMGDKDVVLTVRDNGKGMPAEKFSAKESLGILGMQERALAFGGELVFCSAPGAGTTVRVRIPQ